MDVLKSMQVFRRVAESGSFSAVARESEHSQSSVSKLVAALEKRLSTKLLNRSTRQLKLTEEGLEYYGYCCHILDDLSEAEASVGQCQKTPTGTLRVSATEPFGKVYLMPFLCDFLNQYPDIKIDLILENRYADLVKEGIDVAIRIGPLKDSNLIARKIGMSPRVVVASPEYLLKKGEPLHPYDLKDHDCITYSLVNAPSEWSFIKDSKEINVNVSGRLRASSPDIIGTATAAGLGISTMMLYSAKTYISSGQLVSLLSDYRLPPYEVNAIYPERKFVPQKVKLLISYLKDCFSQT